MTASNGIQRVSIIVPMLNEGRNVENLVADIAAQSYAGEIEVIVADGGSTDDSASRLRTAAAAAGLDLTILDNPARFVSHGLNACIGRARGDLIVRLDCHSRYPADYVAGCVAASDETGAWNVGGLTIPVGSSRAERAVACAQNSPFGGIGWTRLTENGRRETDTVVFGAFKPDTFELVGLYDETLVRNQDDELNLRIRAAGGTIVLDPSIRAFYTPRGSLRKVFSQYFAYGAWKIPVMRKHRQVASLRSLAPAGFVGSIIVLTAAAAVHRLPRRLLATEIALYGSGALVASFRSVRARGEPIGLVPVVLPVFPAFHLGYGLGMLRGLLLPRPASPSPAPAQQQPVDAPRFVRDR